MKLVFELHVELFKNNVNGNQLIQMTTTCFPLTGDCSLVIIIVGSCDKKH